MANLIQLYQKRERIFRERDAADDDATFDNLSDQLWRTDDAIMAAPAHNVEDITVKAAVVAANARSAGSEGAPLPYVERLCEDVAALARR